MSGWSYDFHGRGCCLTHADGTTLDVNFIDGGTAWIDPWFFNAFLQSIPTPDPPEARLRAVAPIDEHWMADLDQLTRAGLIEGDHAVRLTPAGVRLAARLALAETDPGATPWTRGWHAWALGDAPRTAELLGDAAPEAVVVAADECVAARVRALRQAAGGLTNRRASLKALARHGRGVAEPAVLDALSGDPIDGVVSTALKILRLWLDETHLPALIALMARAHGTDIPLPFVRLTAVEMAMLVEHRRTISSTRIAHLTHAATRPARSGAGLAGFLLTLLDPPRGRPALQRALTSEVPIARTEAAAALAALDAAMRPSDGDAESRDEAFDDCVRAEFDARLAALAPRWRAD